MRSRTICLVSSLLLISAFSLVRADQSGKEIFGTMQGKKGATVTIKLEKAETIAAGKKVDLYKYFTKVLFGMNTSGWLNIADAVTVSCRGDILTLRVVKENSVMTVNNKKVDHFQKGLRVKVILP